MTDQSQASSSTESAPASESEGGFVQRLFVRKWLVWVVAVVVLGADLWSKEWAEKNLTREVVLQNVPDVLDPAEFPRKLRHDPDLGREGQEFIPGVLHLKWAENYGAAFSIGSGNRGLLTILSLGVLAIVIYYVTRTSSRHRFALVCLGLVIGGAIGNLYDRLLFDTVDDRSMLLVDGEWQRNPDYGAPTTAVRDMLYWPFDIPIYSTAFLDKGESPRKWPIFNIADVGIVSGVVGLMIVITFAGPPSGRRREETDTPDGEAAA